MLCTCTGAAASCLPWGQAGATVHPRRGAHRAPAGKCVRICRKSGGTERFHCRAHTVRPKAGDSGGPSPVLEILEQGHGGAVGMELLGADVQAIADVVHMLYIDNPDPGALALHGGTGGAVPLGQLPVLVSCLGVQSFHGGLQVAVSDRGAVALGVVVVVPQRIAAVVQAVAFVGIGGAPAHEYRVGEHALGNVVPAGALHIHLNAHAP